MSDNLKLGEENLLRRGIFGQLILQADEGNPSVSAFMRIFSKVHLAP